jgi:hypothetical protein
MAWEIINPDVDTDLEFAFDINQALTRLNQYTPEVIKGLECWRYC